MAAQVISAIQSKGGAGKTTLLMSLASLIIADGFKVRLIDTDPRHHLTKWAIKSGLKDVLQVVEDEQLIVKAVRSARKETDLVFIDTAGIMSQMTVFVTGVSDLVFVPTKASDADLDDAIDIIEKIKGTSEMIGRDVPHLVVLSQLDIRANITAHIIKKIKKAGYPLLDAAMHDRTAFKEMYTRGGAPRGGARKVASEVLGNLQTELLLDCYSTQNREAVV